MTVKDFQKYAKKIPDAPGVYFFLGSPSHKSSARRGRKILYIGKAGSLRNRVRSYFSCDLMEARSPAIAGMIEQASALKCKKTDSVLEALILEANLIKKHQPPFNIEQKDNKSWNYVVITKEKFPRVLTTRGRELFGFTKSKFFGPYPHSGQLREALRIVRKIFPFRDRCVPCNASRNFVFVNSNELANKMPGGEVCKPCFNRQIGLCPGVCSGEIGEKEYAKIIRNIRNIFSGNFRGVKRRLAAEMKMAAKAEEYERAEELRRQVLALKHIRDISLLKGERRIAIGGVVQSGAFRVEAYDVAHTAGTETVGVMTVVEDGEPTKKEYRTFNVRGVRNDDTKALAEIIARRLAHPEWRLPRLIVVDGWKAQVNAARRVLERSGVSIPICGVVKDEFHRPRAIIGERGKASEEAILLANSEAHRFAIAFHRRRRGKLMG